MGHLTGKDIYRQLGEKIDGLATRAPQNDRLFAILRELYSEEEASLVAAMPYGLADLDRIAKLTGQNKAALQKNLESLCAKGLILDLWLHDQFYYTPSPMVIGIFEFTMMRTQGRLNTREWAKLFHAYLMGDDAFIAKNFRHGEKVSFMRTLPHEETLTPKEHLAILDYEKAAHLIDQAESFAIGICSCRHEKYHLGTKKCEVPLDTCSSLGFAADYLVRNRLARRVTKKAMLDNLARSKELGLVLNADNVQKNITFICHCCKCCCNALGGIKKFGYPNVVVTSNYLAQTDSETCTGCGMCAKACPIDNIEMVPDPTPQHPKRKKPVINNSFCLGCGVCALRCPSHAMHLVGRAKRVITPESTFEKVLLTALEKGTLQNQIFDNPNSVTQKFMRGLLGGFLCMPPVKKALMTDTLRSTFLRSMKFGAALQRKEWLNEI